MEDEIKTTYFEELEARMRERERSDAEYRAALYASLAYDEEGQAALMARWREGRFEDLASILKALRRSGLLFDNTIAELRDALLKDNYIALRGEILSLFSSIGASAVSSAGMTEAALRIAREPLASPGVRRRAVAALACVQRANSEVRAALYRIACKDESEAVRFEAEQALIAGSGLLGNWLRALERQAGLYSALLHEVAAHGSERFLGFLRPVEEARIVDEIGANALPVAKGTGDLVRHLYTPWLAHLSGLNPVTGPRRQMRTRGAAKRPVEGASEKPDFPLLEGAAGDLAWLLTRRGVGRLRLQVSAQGAALLGTAYQLFEVGGAYPDRFGFMGYLILRPDGENSESCSGALEWNAEEPPASPEWLFAPVDRAALTDEERSVLEVMPEMVENVDPESVPAWRAWLADPDEPG